MRLDYTRLKPSPLSHTILSFAAVLSQGTRPAFARRSCACRIRHPSTGPKPASLQPLRHIRLLSMQKKSTTTADTPFHGDSGSTLRVELRSLLRKLHAPKPASSSGTAPATGGQPPHRGTAPPRGTAPSTGGQPLHWEQPPPATTRRPPGSPPLQRHALPKRAPLTKQTPPSDNAPVGVVYQVAERATPEGSIATSTPLLDLRRAGSSATKGSSLPVGVTLSAYAKHAAAFRNNAPPSRKHAAPTSGPQPADPLTKQTPPSDNALAGVVYQVAARATPEGSIATPTPLSRLRRTGSTSYP
jgi:hypothetical protein